MHCYPDQVTNIVATAAAIAAVASQPITHNQRGSTKPPMMSRRLAMNIITIISGTATTPLITAVQNRALIGLISTKLIPSPTSVPATIVA